MKRLRTGLAIVVPMVLGLVVPALPAAAAASPQVEIVVIDGQAPGELEPGTSSDVEVFLWNDGDEPATGVTGILSSTAEGVNVTVPGPQPYADIEPNNQVTPVGNAEPFVVAVAAGTPCGAASFTLDVTTDQGTFAVPFDITVGGECVDQASPLIAGGAADMSDAETGEPVEDLTIGRPVTVEIRIHNIGDADAESVTGTLSAPAADAEITDAFADFGAIPVDEDRTGSYALTMTTCDPGGMYLHLAVEGAPVLEGGITSAPPGTLEIRLETRCPGLHVSFKGAIYDDAEGGNGDGQPQPGETLAVTIYLENEGADALTDLQATLTAKFADVIQGSSSFPTAAPGEIVGNSVPFVVRVHDDAPTFDYSTGGCSWWDFNGQEPIAPDTVASIGATATITGAGGQTVELPSNAGVVCVLSMPAVGGGAGVGDVLPETGATTAGTGAVGVALVLLGVIMRRRAGRP